MSRSLPPSSASSPGPSAVDASLHLLAHQVLDDLRVESIEPCLLFVEPEVETVRLGVKPLDGMHPTSLLLGFDAPAGWYALGMATAGWAYDVADRATIAPERHRVFVVTIVSRSGELAHRTHVVGDGALASRLDAADDGVSGEQVDLLRRALGLETPAPPCGTEVFWTIEWLAAVLSANEHSDLNWNRIAALHPARRVLRRTAAAHHEEFGLASTATVFARACPWERLRALSAEGQYDVAQLSPAEARWLDDGAFARFVLNRCPPLSQMRARLRAELPAELAGRIDLVLDEAGVPESSWPDQRAA